MRIKSTSLLSNTSLEFGNFNVFVGGNAVGKTTFLLELYARATHEGRSRYHWVNNVEWQSEDRVKEIELLLGSVSRKFENNNWYYYFQASKDIQGNVDLSDRAKLSAPDIERVRQSQDDIFTDIRFRRPFISFSSCDARLGLQTEVGLTPYDQPAQDAINVLYRDESLFRKIADTIKARFNFDFLILNHTGTKLHLGLSRSDEPPEFDNANKQASFERTQDWMDENFTPISEAGHGIRSMIRLLTSLFDPVNQVIVIDEPEMHLYPVHKRWLGRQLVTLAQEQSKQVFLVTHDPIILQGILDVNPETNIYRVDRQSDETGTVKAGKLKRWTDVGANANQDQYLQSMFYRGCVVVEGASDRAFYQNMFERLDPEIHEKDFGFVSAGGKNNTVNIATIASRVGLNVAFIYDFDVLLTDIELLQKIYSLLGGTKTDLFSDLRSLFESVENIRKEKYKGKREKLIRSLCGYSDKYGMSGEWTDTHKTIFDQIIADLASVGIFIVPTGTLESWAPDVEPKIRFAELAPDAVVNNTELMERFKQFSDHVLRYL